MKVTNNTIRRFLGLTEVHHEFEINKVSSLGCRYQTLMFLSKEGYDLEALDACCDSVILVDPSYPEFESMHNDFIRVDNPKYVFCVVVKEFNLKSAFQLSFDYSVTRRKYTKYCKECIVLSGCNIDKSVILGGEDFSPVMGVDRSILVQFPQLGGVFIGKDVTIKYNSMVGKGTFGYTYIGNRTMIDYGCQIGHNCQIGESCIIAAGTIIGGSTTIGDRCTIGIGAKIRNGIKIGNDVSVGMGAVVIKDVPDGCVVVGNPARVIEHKSIFDEKGLV